MKNKIFKSITWGVALVSFSQAAVSTYGAVRNNHDDNHLDGAQAAAIILAASGTASNHVSIDPNTLIDQKYFNPFLESEGKVLYPTVIRFL